MTNELSTLQKQFVEKSDRLGPNYQPRTRHLNKDGTAKYTNRLFLETSPYLLQHAHNPVNWFPWGDEAFKMAKKLNRPVLLSIGYSTCHWCHVMEEESFEDEKIADFLNSHYIAIKVDREERPDIDATYMKAVQALTGRGGWPMTVWLSPDRKPFYGGTYYPAKDGDRGVGVGFLTILKKIDEVFHQDKEKISQASSEIIKVIQQKADAGKTTPNINIVNSVVNEYKGNFDSIFGGLSGSPKFPSSMSIPLLLRYSQRHNDLQSRDMATITLDGMANGGIYDHVGGGFHRYSTDYMWLVPHFEKMLYDNALLTVTYLEGFQLTGNQDYADVARDILKYVGRDMTSPEGAFYSATDADSITPEGRSEEGYYYTWTIKEIDNLLDKNEARNVKKFFNVTENGNFEGRNIFHITKSVSDLAKELDVPDRELRRSLITAKEKLLEARQKRPLPIRDEKIITAWNGLMISAFAKAGLILDEKYYTNHGIAAANFVLTHLVKNNRLYRSYKDGEARNVGYLSDYAFFIAALLDLYEATSDVKWFEKAVIFDSQLVKYYEDTKNGGFYMTASDQEKLLIREKPGYDGAIPSGNSVEILNLLRLNELTTNDAYRKRAEKALRSFSSSLSKNPTSNAQMLVALDFYHDKPKEIVIVVANNDKDSLVDFMNAFRKQFIPNHVLVIVDEDKLGEVSELIPIVRGKIAQQGRTTAYVCIQGVCDLPSMTPEEFAKQLN